MGVFTMEMAVLETLIKTGRIRPKHLWAGLKGSVKYRAAMAMPGRQRAPEDAQACANVCLTCTARTTAVTDRFKGYGLVQVSFCGKPLPVEGDGTDPMGPDGQGPVCGCIVGTRCLNEDPEEMRDVWHDPTDAIEARFTGGGLMAAGKCLVKGETCPRGKWPAPRVTFGE